MNNLETWERRRNRKKDFRLQTSDVSRIGQALHAAAVRAACRSKSEVGCSESGKRHSCRFCIGASL